MMDAYNITRMDWDAIHELDQVIGKGNPYGAILARLTFSSSALTTQPILAFSKLSGMQDPLKQVETKVKTAFTRAYNKRAHKLPFADVVSGDGLFPLPCLSRRSRPYPVLPTRLPPCISCFSHKSLTKGRRAAAPTPDLEMSESVEDAEDAQINKGDAEEEEDDSPEASSMVKAKKPKAAAKGKGAPRSRPSSAGGQANKKAKRG